MRLLLLHQEKVILCTNEVCYRLLKYYLCFNDIPLIYISTYLYTHCLPLSPHCLPISPHCPLSSLTTTLHCTTHKQTSFLIDHTEYHDDLNEALVTITCQVSDSGWEVPNEKEAFVTDFLSQHLLNMRQFLLYSR